MSEPLYLNVAVNVPLSREFDYLPPAAGTVPAIGARVRVPFGARKVVGLVLGHSAHTDVPAGKLRRAEIVDSEALFDEHLLWLLRFTTDYYHHPVGEVVAAALPAGLRQGKSLYPQLEIIAATAPAAESDVDALSRRAPRQAELLMSLIDAGAAGLDADTLTELHPNWRRAAGALETKGLLERRHERSPDFDEDIGINARPGPPLNPQQAAALAQLRSGDSYAAYLLDGVTGSGKTEVYLQRMQDTIDAGRQVLVLVPEIGLTPQLIGRLRARLGLEPALLHSAMLDSARLSAWRAARSGAARLIVGTRSAIFVPMKNPGLIVVDEEHDHSFKQQEGLRYSARDLAVARAKQLDIAVILGSATPTLEALQHCRRGNWQHIKLSARAGGARPPTLKLVDTVRTPTSEGISEPLGSAIRQHLDDDGQVLLFLNRRGFAPTLICTSCAHVADCPRCDARMTVHAKSGSLRCHHCGYARARPDNCEQCGEPVRTLGEGTEQLEMALRQRFSDCSVQRIDSDTVRNKGEMDIALEGATSGAARLLIGTQMLSKGHHFPNLTLVGIVNPDPGLFGTDFRSAERMAQSIIQVAGRAGREQRQGEVLIQTAYPDNPFWRTLLEGGYHKVAEEALVEREQTGWPPFAWLALFRANAHRRADAHQFLDIVRQQLLGIGSKLRVLGPVDAPMARRAGRYRVQLLLQSHDRATLHLALRALRPRLEDHPAARKVRWSIDVDPVELF